MGDKDWFVLPGIQHEFFRYLDIVCDYLSQAPRLYNKPLLILGDSGVGKSLFINVARQVFLHNLNKDSKLFRATDGVVHESGGPGEINTNNFLKVNCSSFQRELADSELFGHVKGAFSGAISNKVGIVEATNNGLLILDEIGELPDPVQAKLLIFIEEGEYRRVGSNETRRANIKIIGTTNRKKGDFRLDFWHRFYPFILPPLYERRRDVLYYILAKYPFIFQKLTCQHVLTLLAYHWPGNFREVDKVIATMCLEDSVHQAGKNNINSDQLLLPLDIRKTSLADIYPAKFSKNLLDFGFNFLNFNLIISRFGLQIPFFYSTTIESLNLLSESIRFAGEIGLLQKAEAVASDLLQAKMQKIWDEYSLYSTFRVTNCQLAEPLQHSRSLYDFIKYRSETNCDYEVDDENSRKINSLTSDFLDIINAHTGRICFYRDVKIKYSALDRVPNYLGKIHCVDFDGKINNAVECFNAVCKLFLKNKNSNSNSFDTDGIYVDDLDEDSALQRKILKMFNKCDIISSAITFSIKKKIEIPSRYDVNTAWRTYVKPWVVNDKADTSVLSIDHPTDIIEINFLDYTQDELLKKYYTFILSKYKTFRAASRHIGVSESTLRNRMISLGMDPKNKY